MAAEPMPLAALLAPAHVLVGLRAPDKARLLQDLARRAGAVLGVAAGDIAGALAAREALGSTGVGAGIALPHAPLPALHATAAFLARLDRKVPFDAVDGQPIDLVFLLLGPPAARAEHLAALAAATRRLRDKDTAAALRAAPDAAALRRVFLAAGGEG
jgi:PTS system nitrogen regulatory IIA component